MNKRDEKGWAREGEEMNKRGGPKTAKEDKRQQIMRKTRNVKGSGLNKKRQRVLGTKMAVDNGGDTERIKGVRGKENEITGGGGVDLVCLFCPPPLR